QHAAGAHRSAGGERCHDGHRRHRAEQRTNQERFDTRCGERAVVGLAVPPQRDVVRKPGTVDLHHAEDFEDAAMTSTALKLWRATAGARHSSPALTRLAGGIALAALVAVTGCTK